MSSTSSLRRGIDLFQTNADDINVGVELCLPCFARLWVPDYNSELERVLRYASFLLMTAGDFSFLRLRELLTDVEYRSQIIDRLKDQVPTSVTRFFLADFNELRTRAYASAIAPIIVFIDEMQMVPVFNDKNFSSNLAGQITNNFLTIFSLSRPRLGNKVTQTIAGLLFQQLFLFAQKSLISQHLIVIVDEVAIIENQFSRVFYLSCANTKLPSSSLANILVSSVKSSVRQFLRTLPITISSAFQKATPNYSLTT